MTRVLGVEGTAWAASAAVFDAETDDLSIETDPYFPESGGLHPREAAEHMREALPGVIGRVLDDLDDPPDAVAFSRGPGLGPCLRICATAARALALALDRPLVGVNHMVAHLEIGRHRSGFCSPVCLNASGANAHVLGYRAGRYRVLGETMDTGVGNALDKFARHLGWPHPGGPRIEEAARGGSYLDLPYVVKGMDFSFSGLTTAAIAAVERGEAVEDVCFSLQETTFAMLAEVTERALSLTGRDELVLGGGVGQNDRLQEVLGGMCDERGAHFFVPEGRLLRDNAGMIAVLGAMMHDAGDTLTVEESRVRPDFRPDEVEVTWRDEGSRSPPSDGRELRGAEAVVEVGDGEVTKRRLEKPYRHPALDARLRRERTTAEARLTAEARRLGVPTPVVHDVDPERATLRLERVGGTDLAGALEARWVDEVARHLATLHAAGIAHGDPTTRNARVDNAAGRTYLIDFGLGFHTDDVEDFAMDLHVLEGSLVGTADDADSLRRVAEAAYTEAGEPGVIERLRAIERRGRYQST